MLSAGTLFFFFGCFETAAMEHSTIFPAVPPMKPFVMFLALDVQQGCYVDVMDVIIFSFLCFCLLSSLVGQLIHFDSFFFLLGVYATQKDKSLNGVSRTSRNHQLGGRKNFLGQENANKLTHTAGSI